MRGLFQRRGAKGRLFSPEPYPLEFDLFDSWLPSLFLGGLLFFFLTLLFPFSGLATALLSLAGVVFGLWPQLKLKRADIVVKHGEQFTALIKEAYHDGKGGLATASAPAPRLTFTADHVRSFFERFWSLQQSQFSFWRQGLLSDDTLVYWLTRRLSDLDSPDRFFGKTSHEGWDAISHAFASTDFGVVMTALIEDATRCKTPEELRRRVERALVASMTEGKGGLRLLKVAWPYRWFAMSRPDLTASETKAALAEAIATRHTFLETNRARRVSRLLWLILIVIFALGIYNIHSYAGGDPFGPRCCPTTTTTSTTLSTTSTVHVSTTTSSSNTSTSTTSTIPGYACLPTTSQCASQTFEFDRFDGTNSAPKTPPMPLEVAAREIANKCPSASEIVVIGRTDDEHFLASPRGSLRSNLELAATRANTIGDALEAEFARLKHTPRMQKFPVGIGATRTVEVLVFEARCAGQAEQQRH